MPPGRADRSSSKASAENSLRNAGGAARAGKGARRAGPRASVKLEAIVQKAVAASRSTETGKVASDKSQLGGTTTVSPQILPQLTKRIEPASRGAICRPRALRDENADHGRKHQQANRSGTKGGSEGHAEMTGQNLPTGNARAQWKRH